MTDGLSETQFAEDGATMRPDFPPGFEWDAEEERPRYTLYTANEIAEALGVAERTVRRWITSGRLDAKKEQGVFRIKLDEARRVFNDSRGGYSAGRASMEGYIAWLEAENDRLWKTLEKAVSRA